MVNWVKEFTLYHYTTLKRNMSLKIKGAHCDRGSPASGSSSILKPAILSWVAGFFCFEIKDAR
jgi:hypothetical protein